MRSTPAPPPGPRPVWTVPARKPRETAGPGFSLAELAVVLVLLGVALSVVLPRLGGFGAKERLRTTARLLAGQALEAHAQAASTAKARFLCLDLDEKRTWLSTIRPRSGAEAPASDRETVREGRPFILPRDVTVRDVVHPTLGVMKEGRLAFGYWPQGGSEPGTIHLKNEDGAELTIFLRPQLGQTEIKEGYLREETK